MTDHLWMIAHESSLTQPWDVAMLELVSVEEALGGRGSGRS